MSISSAPRLSGLSFQQHIYGGILPLRIAPVLSNGRPAASPIDTSRKDSTLRLSRAFRLRATRHELIDMSLGREARRGPPVASEKPILFYKVKIIARFCEDIV
jgi:hypothetical protein